MPTICSFYGILIQMFWPDRAPPHFHALYAEHEAQIDTRTLEVIEGDLPKRALALVPLASRRHIFRKFGERAALGIWFYTKLLKRDIETIDPEGDEAE
jgi:hypothetical protein